VSLPFQCRNRRPRRRVERKARGQAQGGCTMASDLLKSAGKKAIETVIGQVVTSLLTTTLIITMATGGLKYFVGNHLVPGWCIAVVPALLAVFALHAIVQRRKIRMLSPIYAREPHVHGGLEWILTPIFFLNYKALGERSITSPGFLDNLIEGPFCVHCKRDAYTSLSAGNKCMSCGKSCNVWDDRVDPETLPWVRTQFSEFIEDLKRTVYVEAQAAARRGELSQR